MSYHVHFKDKLASRAKLATVDGKLYWSLRCEEHATGKVCYVLYDEDVDTFVVTEKAPQVWVLQQRNAWKKLNAYAKSHGDALAYPRPYLAKVNGEDVWAVPLMSKGYLVCTVSTAETSRVEQVSDSLAAKMDGSPLQISVGGLDVTATCWLEAELAK